MGYFDIELQMHKLFLLMQNNHSIFLLLAHLIFYYFSEHSTARDTNTLIFIF